jgi:hypothetical protein
MSVFLNSTTLTGLYKSALTMLFQNEIGGNDATAFPISQPVSGAAAGNSGWTIGLAQPDFHTNSGAAQSLLVDALVASGNFTTSEAQNVGSVIVNSGTSATINFGTLTDGYGNPVTVASINKSLATIPAENVIVADANTEVTNVVNNTISFVANDITSSTYAAELTPGSSTFDPQAFLTLVDIQNQFTLSPGGAFNQLLNTGYVQFPGGSSFALNPTLPLGP